MFKNKKLLLLCLVFAFIYLLVIQQGILLLTDYTEVEISYLYQYWQTFFSLFIFNLLVTQTTKKYFKNRQNLYLPVTVGIASGFFPVVFGYTVSDVWTFMLTNVVVFAITLFANNLIEKVYIKSNQDGNN